MMFDLVIFPQIFLTPVKKCGNNVYQWHINHQV